MGVGPYKRGRKDSHIQQLEFGYFMRRGHVKVRSLNEVITSLIGVNISFLNNLVRRMVKNDRRRVYERERDCYEDQIMQAVKKFNRLFFCICVSIYMYMCVCVYNSYYNKV